MLLLVYVAEEVEALDEGKKEGCVGGSAKVFNEGLFVADPYLSGFDVSF